MCGCKGKCGCNIVSTTKGEKGDANSASNLGYKQLLALFSQSGTSAPTMTNLVNTTGITFGAWTRASAGFYKLSVPGMTHDNSLTPFGNWHGNAGTYQVVSDQSTVLGYITYYTWDGGEELWLEVIDATFTSVDYSTLFTSGPNTPKFPIDLKLFF